MLRTGEAAFHRLEQAWLAVLHKSSHTNAPRITCWLTMLRCRRARQRNLRWRRDARLHTRIGRVLDIFAFANRLRIARGAPRRAGERRTGARATVHYRAPVRPQSSCNVSLRHCRPEAGCMPSQIDPPWCVRGTQPNRRRVIATLRSRADRRQRHQRNLDSGAAAELHAAGSMRAS